MQLSLRGAQQSLLSAQHADMTSPNMKAKCSYFFGSTARISELKILLFSARSPVGTLRSWWQGVVLLR